MHLKERRKPTQFVMFSYDFTHCGQKTNSTQEPTILKGFSLIYDGFVSEAPTKETSLKIFDIQQWRRAMVDLVKGTAAICAIFSTIW
jgi:hypothetical protein